MQPGTCAASLYDHKTRIDRPKYGRSWFHAYQVKSFAAVPGLFKRVFVLVCILVSIMFLSGFFAGFFAGFFGWLNLKIHVSKCYLKSNFQLFFLKFSCKPAPRCTF